MVRKERLKADSVVKNFLYQSSYQILSVILPLITTPYISRVLGTDGIGVYSYTTSIVFLFTMVANLGIANYGSREIALASHDENKLSKTFFEIYACHAFVSFFVVAVYFIFVLTAEVEYQVYYFWLGFQVIATLFDITWFFSGIQTFKVTVRRNFIIRILSVLAIFTFVRTKDDLWKYLFIQSFGNLIGQIMVLGQLSKYIHFEKIKISSIKKHMKPMVVLFLPVLAVSVYRYIDKIMIPFFSDIRQLGLYENAERIVSLPLSLITTIGVVMLPQMASLEKDKENTDNVQYRGRIMKYSCILACAICGGLIGISRIFAPVFFGEEFTECGILMASLSISILFITLSNTIRSLYLIPKKKDSIYIIATFSGAALNLFLNLVLITQFGAMGAVIATVVTECVVAIIHIVNSLQGIDFGKLMKDVLPFFCLGILMAMIVYFISGLLQENVTSLFLLVGVGVLIYCSIGVGLLWAQKDDIIFRILNRKRR